MPSRGASLLDRKKVLAELLVNANGTIQLSGASHTTSGSTSYNAATSSRSGAMVLRRRCRCRRFRHERRLVDAVFFGRDYPLLRRFDLASWKPAAFRCPRSALSRFAALACSGCTGWTDC
jgi:hypothetical protein